MRSLLLTAGLVVAATSSGIIRLTTVPESSYVTLGQSYLFVGRFNGNSGVLIGDNMVLTAGHLFPGGAATVPFVLNGVTYQVTNCMRDPLYNGGNIVNGHDFTIGRITTRVTTIAPVKMSTGNAAGQTGVIAGYGITGVGTGGATTGNGVRRAGTNVIENFGDGPNCWWTDFDDGSATNNTLPGSLQAATATEGHLGTGDSGGGLFMDIGGVPHLVGINSFNGRFDDNPNPLLFGSVSGFSKLSADGGWIESTLNSMNPGRVSGTIVLSNLSIPMTNTAANVTIHDVTTDAQLETSASPIAIDGGWTISTALRGNYRVRVKAGTWLSRSQVVNITNGWTRNIAQGNALNGDCNGDNIIDIADYSLLASKFDLTSTSAGWDVRADLNRDNIVDIADYTILATNFDAVGQ
ncbi:MAG: trypsin-like serine protease [Chthonomonas sp.]|nr:trypsin-like serine protease [Chthonomonas sp.]